MGFDSVRGDDKNDSGLDLALLRSKPHGESVFIVVPAQTGISSAYKNLILLLRARYCHFSWGTILLGPSFLACFLDAFSHLCHLIILPASAQ